MQLIDSPSLATTSAGFASEVKFVIDRSLAEEIRGWAKKTMLPDPHGAGPDVDTYSITTLYLDTPTFEVLGRKGSYARSKYRIRRYGASEQVFLERKMKVQGRTKKRRTEIPVERLWMLSNPLPELTWPGYWFHRRVLARRLEPVCQISYTRTARVSRTSLGPIRLTLDDQLQVVPVNGYRFIAQTRATPALSNQLILELKYMDAMPQLFSEMTERFGLVPGAASKYRIAGAALGFASGPNV